MIPLCLLCPVLLADPPGDTFGSAVAVVGDVDGDQVADWVASDQQGPGVIEMHSGRTGAWLWSIPGPNAEAAWGQTLAAAGDWNADGIPDVAVTCTPRAMDNPNAFIVSGNDGALVHEIPRRGGEHWADASAGGADLDRDGLPDLVIIDVAMRASRNSSTLEAWSGRTGARIWTTSSIGPSWMGSPLANAGDLTGDDVVDLLAATRTMRSNSIEIGIALVSGKDGVRVDTWKQPTWRAFVDVDVVQRKLGEPWIVTASIGAHGTRRPARIDAFVRRSEAPIWSFELDDALGDVDLALCTRHDLTGDGVDDVVIGQRMANLFHGRVDAYDGATRTLVWSLANSQGEDFGYAVVAHSDLDSDGVGDYLVAAACPCYGMGHGFVVAVSGSAGREVYRVGRRESRSPRSR